MTAPCRTRFAPSPTGSLHVGGVRTALYCLLHARQTGGAYVLRIEDTDQARSSESASLGIQRDLKWCGLDWDEGPGKDGGVGPYFQAQRLAIYDQYVEQLLASGHAYEAWETREELDAARDAAEAQKLTFRYRRPTHSEAQIAAFRAEGRKPVVRLAAPNHAVTVQDRILGDVTIEASDLDDIVIRKDDGFPTYHFAVVIDDALMKIDLILRGQEHLMNTHKHHGICEALGWQPVACGHLPLIFSPRGSKMSKRDKAKTARQAAREASKDHPPGWFWLADLTGRGAAELELFMSKANDDVEIAVAIGRALRVELPMIEVMDFRRAGYVPEALVNYLALLGWSPGDDRELMTVDELVTLFSIDRIGRTPARFDPEKLKWMNGEYLRTRLTDDRILDCFKSWFEVVDSPLAELPPERLMALFQMYRPRIQTLAELETAAAPLLDRPSKWDHDAVDKHLRKGGGLDRLTMLRTALADVGRWEAPSLESAVQAMAESSGVGLGKLAQPMRVALTGTAASPSIFDVLAFLGRDETLARLEHAVELFTE